VLQAFADLPILTNEMSAAGYRAMRQVALRMLVATSPDYQVC
jgi:hypothetical protein